jgi:hypothetical protein
MRSIFLGFLTIIISTSLYSNELTDAQIQNIIIKESVTSYLQSIGNCPCPYNKDRAGRSCGKRSAWAKPGGRSPICYPNDVTKEMLENYKNNKEEYKHGTDTSVNLPSPTGSGTEDPGVKIQP